MQLKVPTIEEVAAINLAVPEAPAMPYDLVITALAIGSYRKLAIAKVMWRRAWRQVKGIVREEIFRSYAEAAIYQWMNETLDWSVTDVIMGLLEEKVQSMVRIEVPGNNSSRKSAGMVLRPQEQYRTQVFEAVRNGAIRLSDGFDKVLGQVEGVING